MLIRMYILKTEKRFQFINRLQYPKFGYYKTSLVSDV